MAHILALVGIIRMCRSRGSIPGLADRTRTGVGLTGLWVRRLPQQIANEIAANLDVIGMQTAENSPYSWHRKAGPIRDVSSLIRRAAKTRASQLGVGQQRASVRLLAQNPVSVLVSVRLTKRSCSDAGGHLAELGCS